MSSHARHRRVVEGLQQRASGHVEQMRLPDIAVALRVVAGRADQQPVAVERDRGVAKNCRRPSPSGRRRSAAADCQSVASNRWPARHCRRARVAVVRAIQHPVALDRDVLIGQTCRAPVACRRLVEGLQQIAGSGEASNRCACPTSAPCVSSRARRSAPGRRRARRNLLPNWSPNVRHLLASGRRRSAAARRCRVEQMRLPDIAALRVVAGAPISTRSPDLERDGAPNSSVLVTVGSSKVCSSAPVVASNRCACPTSVPCVSSARAPISTRSPESATEVPKGRLPSPSGRRRSGAGPGHGVDADAPARHWCPACRRRARRSAPGRRRARRSRPKVSGRHRRVVEGLQQRPVVASNRCACPTLIALRVVLARADQDPVAGERDGAGRKSHRPSPSGRRRSAAARR